MLGNRKKLLQRQKATQAKFKQKNAQYALLLAEVTSAKKPSLLAGLALSKLGEEIDRLSVELTVIDNELKICLPSRHRKGAR